MALPVIDEHHQDIKKVVQQISKICLSEEFLSLKKELESFYLRVGSEHASLLAFQDALYSIMAQEDEDFSRLRAY